MEQRHPPKFFLSLEEPIRDLSVFVAHAEWPSLIWLQLENNTAKDISNGLKQINLAPMITFAGGQYCVAPYQLGSEIEWRRGQIICTSLEPSTQLDFAKVIYIDFGAVVWLSCKLLKVLPDSFIDYNTQAFPCRLRNLAPMSSKVWSRKAIEALKDLTAPQQTPFKADIYAFEQNFYTIELSQPDTPVQRGLNVGWHLFLLKSAEKADSTRGYKAEREIYDVYMSSIPPRSFEPWQFGFGLGYDIVQTGADPTPPRLEVVQMEIPAESTPTPSQPHLDVANDAVLTSNSTRPPTNSCPTPISMDLGTQEDPPGAYGNSNQNEAPHGRFDGTLPPPIPPQRSFASQKSVANRFDIDLPPIDVEPLKFGKPVRSRSNTPAVNSCPTPNFFDSRANLPVAVEENFQQPLEPLRFSKPIGSRSNTPAIDNRSVPISDRNEEPRGAYGYDPQVDLSRSSAAQQRQNRSSGDSRQQRLNNYSGINPPPFTMRNSRKDSPSPPLAAEIPDVVEEELPTPITIDPLGGAYGTTPTPPVPTKRSGPIGKAAGVDGWETKPAELLKLQQKKRPSVEVVTAKFTEVLTVSSAKIQSRGNRKLPVLLEYQLHLQLPRGEQVDKNVPVSHSCSLCHSTGLTSNDPIDSQLESIVTHMIESQRHFDNLKNWIVDKVANPCGRIWLESQLVDVAVHKGHTKVPKLHWPAPADFKFYTNGSKRAFCPIEVINTTDVRLRVRLEGMKNSSDGEKFGAYQLREANSILFNSAAGELVHSDWVLKPNEQVRLDLDVQFGLKQRCEVTVAILFLVAYEYHVGWKEGQLVNAETKTVLIRFE